MSKYYVVESEEVREVGNTIDFENSDYIYKVTTDDSSGNKVYYSKTKDDAWKSLDYMLLGALYEVESKLDDVDDMIPF